MAKKQQKLPVIPAKKKLPSSKKTASSNKKIKVKKTVTIRVKKKSAVIYHQPLWQAVPQNFLHSFTQLSHKYSLLLQDIMTRQILPNVHKNTTVVTQVYKNTQQSTQQFLIHQRNSLKTTKEKLQKKLSRKRPVGRPKKKLPPKHSRLRPQFIFMLVSLVLTVIIFFAAYESYVYVFKDLPSVDELTTKKQNLTTKILDRNGKLLYSIYKDQNRTLIPLSRVPPNMIHATIAVEDKDFYSHGGLSITGILRALESDLFGNRLEGGSTITQQLVKNTLLGPERTLQRKIREAVLAILVENTYTKDEILEMYFNDVPYGGSTYGVEEAAQKYFGIPAAQLDLAQSAFLAGLPAAPSVYSPYGPNPDLAYSRQKEVLNLMVSDKYVTQAQADQAAAEKLNFQPDTNDIEAPHFVMYVRSLLEQEYGEDVVDQGGLEVRTSLDLDTQNQSQAIVTNEMKDLARLNISNGAALVTNPKTGEILAMVGSKDYFDFADDGQVNVTTRPRQPGSSIKPIMYSVALERGATPDTTILDAPVTFSEAGSPPYTPRNYDGRYHGLVTLRTALGSSFNIPAVKTLASIGVNSMIDQAQEMGITTWQDRKRFGLSLALGSGEVLMTDMAQAYGTFANYGVTVPLNPILEVKDYKGDELYRNNCALDNTNCPGTRTLDSKVAYEITDILSDNNARIPAFGPRSVLYIPNQQVAVKTGTTNNLRDNWSFGYTTNRLVAVWVGNNDNQPMSYVASGITGASPIWNKIMRTQLDDAHPSVFPLPSDLVKVQVCALTNTLPCAGCPNVTDEVFSIGTQPTQACTPAQLQAIFNTQHPPSPSPSPTSIPTPTSTPLPAATPRPVTPYRRYSTSPNTTDRILNGVSTQR